MIDFPRPGAKLQLQGEMVCRLGVLLLGPVNVKILGGEVEDLVERNNQVNFFFFFQHVLSDSFNPALFFDTLLTRSRTSM